jgi:hypothetical protein
MRTDTPAGFEPVLAVRTLQSGLTVPWRVVGEWAIDLVIGRATRAHAGVDVMLLLECDEHALRHLPGIGLRLSTGPDDEEQPSPASRRLVAGSDTVHLVSARLSLSTQVLLGAAVGTTWVYHRGKPTITRLFGAVSRQRRGIPYLAPEVVLAMKSMAGRDKDDHDFRAALPLLDLGERQWLQEAITRRWRASVRRTGSPVADTSQHPWTGQLTAIRTGITPAGMWCSLLPAAGWRARARHHAALRRTAVWSPVLVGLASRRAQRPQILCSPAWSPRRLLLAAMPA